ncbi:hypothetical protein ACIRPT_05515 [Streptomyces sp. NPDC101227]|uniref:hypothetical protein n=1 Tax=Streptomyces sp. NPDC101227 TaxID=3366136 RepID=UPI00382E4443
MTTSNTPIYEALVAERGDALAKLQEAAARLLTPHAPEWSRSYADGAAAQHHQMMADHAAPAATGGAESHLDHRVVAQPSPAAGDAGVPAPRMSSHATSAFG